MNEDIFKGKWKDIKGEIQNVWGKLTNDELESVKGNLSSITGLIQQRYGEAKDVVSEKLNRILGNAKTEADSASKDAKQWAVDQTEKAKQSMRDTENRRQY
jgi:uncharacterized protein YjbJ (UPF0337 family)